MRLAVEKRTLITIAIFAATALAIVGGVIYPAAREISREQAEIENLHNFLERRFNRVTTARVAIKRVREIQQTVNDYDQYLFRRGDELKLITGLESIAASHKVTTKITNPNLDQPGSMASLSISISGDYTAVLQYIADLEKFTYFLHIKRIAFSPIIDRADPTVITQARADLDLTLYVN